IEDPVADRLTDNAEAIVDDMKRRARRRLVGAIVFALAAAIILPMLLEKEPRSLGEDVTVQIPLVDDGKFVNRLTGKDTKSSPKADEKADAKGARGKSESKADTTAGSPSSASGSSRVGVAATPAAANASSKSVADADATGKSPAPANAEAPAQSTAP